MGVGDWWRHGVIYQIYPRSFQDSNGDGVGDLAGITSRLDYLNDGTSSSLGIDAIWLSPFYPSPMADFGYDVSDYTDVHQLFGTLADFDALLAAAHDRGIRMVIDFVPNHSSDQHPWFLESRSSRDNPKRDWYVWRDPKPDGAPPNNWKSSFARVGRAWTLDERTGQYYMHSFLPEQPDLNWDNPEVRAAMKDALRFWLDRGVDGFRIDVTHKLGKDPELRDNPPDFDEPTSHFDPTRHDADWESGHAYLREMREVVDSYSDRMLVGEVYLLDQRRLVKYHGSGEDELHLAHNFLFANQRSWDAKAFRAVVDEWELLAPKAAWPNWFTGNHDHHRMASRYDDGGHGMARAKVAAMMVMTLRGTPFLYQGEELGLTDVPIPPERVVDVDGRDPERAPIPWSPGPGAGFTTGTPWLPITADAESVNAEAQQRDPDSTLSYYRRLLELRRRSSALRWGAYRPLEGDDDVFIYLRESDDELLLVALNFAAEPRAVEGHGLRLPADGVRELSTMDWHESVKVDVHALELRPNEGVVIRFA